jgi:hypothetical protein
MGRRILRLRIRLRLRLRTLISERINSSVLQFISSPAIKVEAETKTHNSQPKTHKPEPRTQNPEPGTLKLYRHESS